MSLSQGSGKSALLSAAADSVVQASQRAGLKAPLILKHSFDVAAGAGLGVERALNRLARELKAVFRLSTPVPDDPALAASCFAEVLAACARERRICLVLDGIHCAHFSNGAGGGGGGPQQQSAAANGGGGGSKPKAAAAAPGLVWLPLPPPAGVSVLMAAHSSFPLADAISHVARGTVLEMQLGPLNRADALLLLRRESALFGSISEKQVEAALSKPSGEQKRARERVLSGHTSCPVMCVCLASGPT